MTGQEEAQEKLQQIMNLCEELGWVVMVGKSEESGEIEGIMAGVEEYIDMVVSHMGGAEEATPVKNNNEDSGLH